MRNVWLAVVLLAFCSGSSLAAVEATFPVLNLSGGQGLRAAISSVPLAKSGPRARTCQVAVQFVKAPGTPPEPELVLRLTAGSSAALAASGESPGPASALIRVVNNQPDIDRACAIMTALEVYDLVSGRMLFEVRWGECLGENCGTNPAARRGAIGGLWTRIEQYLLRVPPAASLAGPVAASLLGALVSAGVLLGIARHYTLSIKRIESTLEFSRRFQELIKDREALNRDFVAQPQKAGDTDGAAWWWRFFDLILYEFDFFRQNLVREERFIEWMKWRWSDYRAAPNSFVTCGIDYKSGWQQWKTKDALNVPEPNRLITFLDALHSAPDINAVIRLCGANSPHWYLPWRRFHLN